MGEQEDNELDLLGDLLMTIVQSNLDDIRPIIKKFKEDINKKMRNNMNINPFKGVDIIKYFNNVK